MPHQCCFVCASDEGVFLDVTSDNKQIYQKQIEDCSLSKAITTTKLPVKICHKCAYELNQCSCFVRKYKRNYGTLKKSKKTRKSFCSLCLEPAKKGYIFDLRRDNTSLHHPVNKIKEIFHQDLAEHEGENGLICLHCRYTLDVLFDLKSICEQTTSVLKNIVAEDINYLNFVKTKTSVVSRKTTTTECVRVRLSTSSGTDDETDTMARGQSRVNKLSNIKTRTNSKLRVCEKCKNSVENDGNIYRLHASGLSVCKSCRLTMDSTIQDSKKQRQKTSAQTKSCAVFLKDVLTDKAFRQQHVYRVEKDDQGNKVYIITDDSSESEDKLRKHSVTARVQVTNNRNVGSLRQSHKRSAGSMKSDVSSSEDKPSKKLKSDGKQKDYVNNSASLAVSQHSKIDLKQNSDLDSPVRILRKTSRTIKRTRASVSDADIEHKRSRVKLKNILHGMPVTRTDVSDESSSNEESAPKSNKTKIVSTSPVTDEAGDSKVKSGKKRRQRKPLASTVSQSVEPIDYDSDVYVVEAENYVCEVCHTVYENRLNYLTHHLTHCKQPEIKLERVNPLTTRKEKSDITDTADNQCETQVESISITVHDDEEETHDLDEESSNNYTVIEDDDTTVKVCSIQKQPKDKPSDKQALEIENTRLKESRTESPEKEKSESGNVAELAHEELLCCPDKNSNVDARAKKSDKDSTKKNDEDSFVIEKDTINEDTTSEKRCEENSSNDVQEIESLQEDVEFIQKSPGQEHEKVDVTQKETENDNEMQKQDEAEENENVTKNNGEENENATKNNGEENENATKNNGQENENATKTNEEENEIREDEEDTMQKEKSQEAEAQQEQKDDRETPEEDNKVVETQKETKDDEEMREQSREDEHMEKVVENDDELPDEIQKEKKDDESIQEEDKEQIIDEKDEQIDTSIVHNLIESKAHENIDCVTVDDDELEISKKEEHNGKDEKEVESETEIRIVDTGSSEESNEHDLTDKNTKTVKIQNDDNNEEEETTVDENEVPEKSKTSMNGESIVKKDKVTNLKLDSTNVVTEVLQAVIDLAAAEVQKRQGSTDDSDKKDCDEAETLENISREIYNTSDISSLECSTAT